MRVPACSPYSLNQEQALTYAPGCACFRSGEIRVLDSKGAVERTTTNNRLDAVTFMVIAERDSKSL
jgi:hypothetical protein